MKVALTGVTGRVGSRLTADCCGASGGMEFLKALRLETTLDWTFLSPSAEFEPGERTGTYQVGGDRLLIDDKGRSWISMEDYAIALIDELENPKHSRQRFTVGY